MLSHPLTMSQICGICLFSRRGGDNVAVLSRTTSQIQGHAQRHHGMLLSAFCYINCLQLLVLLDFPSLLLPLLCSCGCHCNCADSLYAANQAGCRLLRHTLKINGCRRWYVLSKTCPVLASLAV